MKSTGPFIFEGHVGFIFEDKQSQFQPLSLRITVAYNYLWQIRISEMYSNVMIVGILQLGVYSMFIDEVLPSFSTLGDISAGRAKNHHSGLGGIRTRDLWIIVYGACWQVATSLQQTCYKLDELNSLVTSCSNNYSYRAASQQVVSNKLGTSLDKITALLQLVDMLVTRLLRAQLVDKL